MDAEITLRVNGQERTLTVDTRTTLLDALRERLGVTSPKKGCDHGQCGSCTVLLDGHRATTCLAFAVAHDHADVLTADGLGEGGEHGLHPVAQAFLDHDGFQCGYCTPGQVCSAIGMLDEWRHGAPSWAGHDTTDGLPDDEIRERMSGNLCRCGAYAGIVAAIREAAGGGQR